MLRRLRPLLVAAALSAAAAVPASPGCYIKSETSSNGLGGLGATEGVHETWYSGDKMAERSHSHMKNAVLDFMTKDSRTDLITRLDKGVFWEVNRDDESYREMSFARMRERMEKSVEEMQKAAEKREPAPGESTPRSRKGEKPDIAVDVRETGKTERIAGYDARETVLTLRAAFSDPGSGEKTTMVLTYDAWLAADFPCADEARDFGARYAEAVGVDMAQGDTFLATALDVAGIPMDTFKEKSRSLAGYPMRFTLNIGADLSPEEQARIEKARREAEAERAREKEKEESGGGFSLGGFGKKLAKKALPGGGEKDDDSEPLPPGVVYSMTSTVVEAGSKNVDESVFEIPEGYKLEND